MMRVKTRLNKCEDEGRQKEESSRLWDLKKEHVREMIESKWMAEGK